MNDAAAKLRKCTSQCENLPRGSAFRWRNTTLVVPGIKNSGSPPTARYFSGLTAAGVRSNIFDTTPAFTSRLQILDQTYISR
jgi:hypothetical protein